MANQTKNSQNNTLKYILIFIGLLGMFFIMGIITYYIIIFKDYTIDADVENFAQFGDFFGGTLNPILAFLSFIALLFTIKIQSDELSETRDELEKSRVAQEEQSKILGLQTFENTFFKLVELFNQNKVAVKNGREVSLDAITSLKKYFENNYLSKVNGDGDIRSAYDIFNVKYEFSTGSYFGQMYQILKFIDSSDLEDENKRKYVNIFRAQLVQNEAKLLFYHCLGTIGSKKFKGYVEKYEFFEHIICDYEVHTNIIKYDIKAYGKNKFLLDIYSAMKSQK